MTEKPAVVLTDMADLRIFMGRYTHAPHSAKVYIMVGDDDVHITWDGKWQCLHEGKPHGEITRSG